MKPFLHLNLNQPVLKDTFVLPPADEPEKGYWKYFQKIPVKDTIQPGLLAKFLSMDLMYQPNCLLFYAPPGAKLKIHKDAGGINAWAINWSLTPNRAGMIWYTTDSAGEEKIAYESTTPTVFTGYQEHEVTEVCREEIRYPSIVRIGIPHGGFNHSDQGAWLLSLRFMSPITWEQANITFKSFIET
jgi:hypothetical protein